MRERGGPGRGGKKTSETVSVVPFAEDTARKAAVTPRSVQQDVQIAERIPEDVRDAIRDTLLADSKTDLLALARIP